VIVTGLLAKSSNGKTGAVPQAWILRADMAPNQALRSGKDSAVCGACPYRSLNGCYVQPHTVVSIYKAWQRGRYVRPDSASASKLLEALEAASTVRIGAYGDPMAVPSDVWVTLSKLASASKVLGYTHAWKLPRSTDYKRWCVASTDSPAQYAAARAKGWRSFRVRLPGAPLLPGEFTCPAAGPLELTCERCGACNGSRKPARHSPSIEVHGMSWACQRAQRVLEGLGQ
jgi:hypothetical protein